MHPTHNTHLFLIPDQFPAQAIAASNTQYRDRAFIVVRQNAESHKSLVHACSDTALSLGIRPGDPVHLIQKRFPGIEILPRNQELETVIRDEIGQIAETVTPEYHVAESGICWMDISRTPVGRRLRNAECGLRNEEEDSTQSTVETHDRASPDRDAQGCASHHPDEDISAREECRNQSEVREFCPTIAGYSVAPKYHAGPAETPSSSLSYERCNEVNNQEVIIDSTKSDIKSKTNLWHIAAGVAGSRIVARIMAQLARPDGIRICWPEDESSTIPNLSINLLPGLSSSARERLRKYGLLTIGQLRELSKDALTARLGKEGEKAYCLAWGVDSASTRGPVEILWSETVLDRDINDMDLLTRQLHYAVDQLCHQLKSSSLVADNLLVLIRYGDNKTTQRTVRISPTSDFLTLSSRATRLLIELYQRRVAIRSIRLITKRPSPETGQLSLFETAWERKQTRLSEGIERVRKKMTFDSVVTASHLGKAPNHKPQIPNK